MIQVRGERLLAVIRMAIIVTGQRVWGEIQCTCSSQECGKGDGKAAFQQQGAWKKSSWVRLGHHLTVVVILIQVLSQI